MLHQTAPARRTGPAVLLALALLVGGCDEGPRPVVGVSTSGRYVNAARLAMIDAAEQAPPLVDTLVIPETSNRSAPAVHAADSFAMTPGILAVIGHSNSAASLAASQIYQQHRVVQIAPHSSATVFSRAGPWSYRLVPPDDAQAAFLVGRVEDVLPDGGRVAILHVNDDYGRGLLGAFTTALDQERHPVVLEYPHTEEDALDPSLVPGTVDATASAEPDLLVWLGRATVLNLYLPALKERLPGTPIMGGDAIGSALQYPNEDGRWDGVMYVDFVDLGATPELRAFARRYEERFGVPATGPDALTYDAVALVLAAVRAGARTPEALRAHLDALGRELPAFQGLTGPIRFDEQGDVEREHVLLRVGGGS